MLIQTKTPYELRFRVLTDFCVPKLLKVNRQH